MKVLFVSNLFPNVHEPARGVFNLRQMQHLACFCPVRVLAPYDWFFIKGRFAPPAPLPARETIGGLTVYHSRNFYLPKIGRTLNPWLYACSARGAIRAIGREFAFDVIYVNWAYPDACGIARVARQLGVPFVASISGSDVNWYLQMRLRRRQILHMLDQAAAVTTRSQALRDLLIQHGVDDTKINVLYNGVEITPLPRSPRRQPPRLLYVGRLSPEKGVADLLHAVARLESPVHLQLAGDGHQREQLRQLAARLGVQAEWLGWQSPAAIPALMAQADLLCLPSHMEGVPNAVLEAMACGLPVVATCVGGVAEVVTRDTAVLVPPRDPAALAAGIQQALTRAWDTDVIRRQASRFDWTENARRLHHILQTAVNAGAS